MLSSEHLAHLIWTARIRSDIREHERKNADLELLAVLESSVCAGDALVQVTTNKAGDIMVRLNAALALPGLIRRHGLLRFVDKETAVASLMHYLLHLLDGSDQMEAKLASSCANALALIAVKDSDARWSTFLEECFRWTCGGSTGAALVLQALSEVAKENAAIWALLASDGVTFFISALTHRDQVDASIRLCILHFFCNLLTHRPRLVATGSISSSDCPLLTAENRQFFVNLFCDAYVAALPSMVGTSDGASLEFAAICRVTALLLNTAATVRSVFAASLSALRTLHGIVPSPATSTIGGDWNEAVYSLLECMTVCLQIFPQDCACGLEELLLLLMPFVTSHVNTELDVQSKLLFMDDEVVPIGCSSDDVPSLALSVIELALDENMAAMNSFLQSVLSIRSSTGNSEESFFLFTFLVLRSISRVLAFKDYVFVEYFDQGCLCAVFQTLVEFTHHGATATPLTWMTCIDVFSMCFSRRGAAELPFCFLKGVSELWDAVAQTPRSEEDRSYLLAACLVVVGRYIELACVSKADMELLPMWFQKALDVTVEGASMFAVYAGSLVLSLLAKSSEVKHILTEHQALVGHALTNMCVEAVERTVAKNVSTFLGNVMELDDASFAYPCAEYLTDLVLQTIASAPLRYNHLLRYLCEYGNKVMLVRVVQQQEAYASDGGSAFNLVVSKMAEPLMHLLPILDLDDGMARASAMFFAQYSTICVVAAYPSYSPFAALRSTIALLERSGVDSGNVNTRNAVCASVAEQLLLCENLNVVLNVQGPIISYLSSDASNTGVAAMGTCLLYSILVGCAPPLLYQACGSSWWSALHVSWCALAPFMDAVTLRCTLISWSVHLFDFLALPTADQQRHLSDTTLFVPRTFFPSPYIKKAPPASKESDVHIIIRIILALYDVKKRWERSPKVNMIPVTFQQATQDHAMPFFLLDKVGVSRFPAAEITRSVNELVHFFEKSASPELTCFVHQYLDF